MTQKNAPAAVGAADEGQITNPTPSEEKTMNTQSIPTPNADAMATLAEWNEQVRVSKAAWLSEHPLAVASMPEWAETIDVELNWGDGGEPAVIYEREIGPLILSRWANWEDGALQFEGGTSAPEIRFLREGNDGLTVDEARALASALIVAIPVVEDAQS